VQIAEGELMAQDLLHHAVENAAAGALAAKPHTDLHELENPNLLRHTMELVAAGAPAANHA